MAVPSSANLSRYLQLALLVLAAGAIYPMLYLRQVYQSTMLEALAISNSELGYLYSILGSAFLVSYLPSGWLADRISPRYLNSFSLLGTGVLGLWYAQLPGFQALLAIFCGFGITTGLTFWASLMRGRVLGWRPAPRSAESPRPMPQTVRLPNMSLRVAKVEAVTSQVRVPGLVTIGPTFSFEVFARI